MVLQNISKEAHKNLKKIPPPTHSCTMHWCYRSFVYQLMHKTAALKEY